MAAHALPNATILINAIPLLEAQASSEIENIVTTTDELFSADAASAPQSPAAREALRYRTALHRGFREISDRPLTSSTASRVCTTIRGHDVNPRTSDICIGNPETGNRIYTPPSPAVLEALLDNWSEFVNDQDQLDPLVRMAIAHYQFEAIHPLTEGNGRTGRILNVLMLCDAHLIHLPILYLSRYIIESKPEYYRLLGAVTAEQVWEKWILYVLEGVRSTALRTLALVSAISEVESRLTAHAREALGSPNSDFIKVLMEQPYTRNRNVMERCGVSRPTATTWLKGLVQTNMLQEVTRGREVLYINTAMMIELKNA